jgi:hypothetical protein
MHSDEVSDERSSPRFELGPTPRVAAVFLLISHLAAPLFPRFEASMMNASTKQFACSTVKLQERRRSFIDKKSDPAGRMRLRLKQDRPTTVHATVICLQATTKVSLRPASSLPQDRRGKVSRFVGSCNRLKIAFELDQG